MTTAPRVTLHVLTESYAVCRLDADHEHVLPSTTSGSIYSASRTPNELSIVCAEHLAPPDATVEAGWTAFVVDGPLDFALTGILASIVVPLAEAEISIFALSTYDTDYVLIKSDQRDAATRSLRAAGHTVNG